MIAGVIAGRLRHRIYIRQPVVTTTDRADQLKTFTVPEVGDTPNAYASIDPLVGRELIVARGIRSDLSHKILLRYCDGKAIDQLSRVYWYDGVEMLCYHMGPMVDRENRHIYISYYATEIR